MAAVTCAFCGTRPGRDPAGHDDGGPQAPHREPGGFAEEVPLTWTTAVERGRAMVFCPACSRQHLRAIESKLDSEWW